jgi:hypothetical protein
MAKRAALPGLAWARLGPWPGLHKPGLHRPGLIIVPGRAARQADLSAQAWPTWLLRRSCQAIGPSGQTGRAARLNNTNNNINRLRKIQRFLLTQWKYLVHFRYVFFYEHILYKLYIYIYKKNSILWKTSIILRTGTKGGPATATISGHVDERPLVPAPKLNRD